MWLASYNWSTLPRIMSIHYNNLCRLYALTHCSRVTHIWIGKLTIIGPDNGVSPGRRQAIIWTSAGILLVGSLGTHFSEILIGIQIFSLKKCIWKCRRRNSFHFVSASMWHINTFLAPCEVVRNQCSDLLYRAFAVVVLGLSAIMTPPHISGYLRVFHLSQVT